jgi:hypothetical protein
MSEHDDVSRMRPDEIDVLARDLRPLVKKDPEGLKARLAALPPRDQTELALRLPPRDRLELLLHAPKPMALVRSLPDFELYLTVREVGPLDAEPLLALASAEQLEHVVDLESWRGDRFDPDRSGAWAALFLEAGEPTLRRFLRKSDDETLILLFRKWLRIHPLEIDHEEPTRGHGLTEAGDERGFLSPDGAHLFSPTIAEHAPAARRFAEILYLDDQERYLGIVHAAKFELPSELEERALQFRTSRLEEHGFVRKEEALEIYAAPRGVGALVPVASAMDEGRSIPPRSLVLGVGTEGSLLHAALNRMPSGEREAVLLGLVSLANRVLVADDGDTGEPSAHRRSLGKAAGYSVAALEARGAADPIVAAELLARVPPLELFRETHARLSTLQDRGRRLFGGGLWGTNDAESLARVDAPLRTKLAGLLLPRPLYYDENREVEPFRDFAALAEIEEIALALDLVERVGAVLGTALSADLAALDAARTGHAESPPRMSSLLLTAAGWHAARGDLRLAPLPADAAAAFVRLAGDGPQAARALVDAFVAACASAFRLADADRAALERFARASAERLAHDVRGVAPASPLDSDRLPCLVLAV